MTRSAFHSDLSARPAAWPALALAIALSTLSGCATNTQELQAPATVVAPYNTLRGEVLWAVVPLRNESGTTEAEKAGISDKLAAACEEIQGVRCVPLNRTLESMRALKMTSVQSPADVRKLAQAMGVDGVVVGSITSYDPYTPALGLALALFSRGAAMNPTEPQAVDPRALQSSPTEGPTAASGNLRDTPVAVASENLDAKNNQVLMDVRQYAQGRLDGPSALGWRRYATSMDLFSEFAASHLVARLVQSEWVRLAGFTPPERPDQIEHRK